MKVQPPHLLYCNHSTGEVYQATVTIENHCSHYESVQTAMASRIKFYSYIAISLDPSAAADRRRKFVRRKAAVKITARQISRRILLAVNPP